MGDNNQQPLLPAEPFYKSPVFTKLVAAGVVQLISLGLRIAKMFGHDLAPDVNMEDIKSIGADIAQFIAFALGIWAMVDRKNSAVHPLTYTAAGAEKQNAANPPILESDPTKTAMPNQTATVINTPPKDTPL